MIAPEGVRSDPGSACIRRPRSAPRCAHRHGRFRTYARLLSLRLPAAAILTGDAEIAQDYAISRIRTKTHEGCAYIKLGKRANATIRQLGYPTKNALKHWYREFARGDDLSAGYVRTIQQYSDEQKRIAVEHCLENGRCLAWTNKALGYPGREKLRAWIDEYQPGQAASSHRQLKRYHQIGAAQANGCGRSVLGRKSFVSAELQRCVNGVRQRPQFALAAP